MRLSDLIDLEVQLHRDEEAERADPAAGAAARARDAAVAADLRRERPGASGRPSTPAARQALAAAWLHHLPQRPRIGEAFVRAVARAGVLLAAAAALLGFAAARTALAYDGTAPVNVFLFLAGLVAVQIALLLLLLLAAAWPRRRSRRSALGRLLVRAAGWRWLGGDAARSADAAALLGRLGLHDGVLRAHLFTLVQRAGFAFNVAAALTCLWLLAFTDIAFGWSSTLGIRPEQLHGACVTIALPWRGLLPDAVPTLHLVESSQWVRMHQSFVGGTALADAARLSGQWWSFLVTALVFWGLLPRLLAWTAGRLAVRRSLRATALDDPRCARLLDRLAAGRDGWSSPADSPGHAASGEVALRPTQLAASAAGGARWGLLAWGRLGDRRHDLAAALTSALGAPPVVVAAGGADLDDDRRALDALAGCERLLLLATAGSQPTKDVVGFVAAARERLGPRARIEVALVAEREGSFTAADAAAELRPWRARIDVLGDPYLAVVHLPLQPAGALPPPTEPT